MPLANLHIPAYVRVKQHFLEKIQNQELKTGEKLPTEQEIATQWGISKMTVRHGLQELVKSGFIVARHGVGFFVAQHTVELDTFQFTSFSSRKRQSISTKVLSFRKIKLNVQESMDLFGEEYSHAWYSDRVRFLDGLPAIYEISRMPFELFPSLNAEDLAQSKYNFVAENSLLPIAASDRTFIPEILDQHKAELLGLKKGDAVIKILSTGFLSHGKIFEQVELYHHPEICKIRGRSPFLSP